MFGVCSECGNQEESKSAKCTSCGHNWHLFPTRPKDLEVWLKPRGPWDRARRCYPPVILNALLFGILSFFTIVVLDGWAIYKGVRLTRVSSFLMPSIMLLDIAMVYLGFKTLRVSIKHFKWLKLLIICNLAMASTMIAHTFFLVIGHDTQSKATFFLLCRLTLFMIAGFVFLQSRVYRALLRHG